jgi:DNA replication protein DnaC
LTTCAGLARADGWYPRLLARLARADVLGLDDWAMAPITEAERRDLLEILEDRYAATGEAGDACSIGSTGDA